MAVDVRHILISPGGKVEKHLYDGPNADYVVEVTNRKGRISPRLLDLTANYGDLPNTAATLSVANREGDFRRIKRLKVGGVAEYPLAEGSRVYVPDFLERPNTLVPYLVPAGSKIRLEGIEE